jgi:hypothetical protein
MMGIEMDSETSVIFSHRSWQIVREDFISTEEQFSIGDDKSTLFRRSSQEESQFPPKSARRQNLYISSKIAFHLPRKT